MHQKLKVSCLWPLLLAAAAISGCEQKPAEQNATQEASGKLGDEQAVAINSTDSATRLVVTEAQGDYVLPACDDKQQPCPKISLSHVVSNDAWVNHFLDQQIFRQYPIKVGKKTHIPDDFQEVADGLLASIKPADPASANFTEKLDTVFLGMYKSFGMFMVTKFSFYEGAAQPYEAKKYYVLDLDRKKQLTLDDLLIKGKQQQLYDLLFQQFSAWVKKDFPQTPMADYEKDNPFTVTSNFSFNKDGVEFLYSPQELGSFAQGAAVFTVPYAQLKGIVKPDYLKD